VTHQTSSEEQEEVKLSFIEKFFEPSPELNVDKVIDVTDIFRDKIN
jgi:hypothetical protein